MVAERVEPEVERDTSGESPISKVLFCREKWWAEPIPTTFRSVDRCTHDAATHLEPSSSPRETMELGSMVVAPSMGMKIGGRRIAAPPGRESALPRPSGELRTARRASGMHRGRVSCG
jgi:hypothetical protein